MPKRTKKNKTVLGVLGVILIIIGFISSISLAIQRQMLGVVIAGIIVIIGVILIAWAVGD